MIKENGICFSCSVDNMQIWNITNGKTISSFQFGEKINDCAIFNSNNICFVSGTSIYFYDIKKREVNFRLNDVIHN